MYIGTLYYTYIRYIRVLLHKMACDSQDDLRIECLDGEFLAKVLTLGALRPDMHWVQMFGLGRRPDLRGPN